jgi:hypothetical protein
MTPIRVSSTSTSDLHSSSLADKSDNDGTSSLREPILSKKDHHP